MDSGGEIVAGCAYGTGEENSAEGGDHSSPSERPVASSNIEAVGQIHALAARHFARANRRTIDGSVGYGHEGAGI